jgi:hypothetical protein
MPRGKHVEGDLMTLPADGGAPPGMTTSKTFERFAGTCALVVGIGGLAYSLAFVLALRTSSRTAVTSAALFLLLGGLLTTPVMVALHQRLRAVDEGFAGWGLLLGVVGALGSAIHGGFDLAKIVGPPTLPTEIPNVVDPRGLLTFGVTGVAVLVFAALIRRGGGLPRGLGWVGAAAGILLILVYLGRLLIFDPTNPALLASAVLLGFVVNPAWFIWLGLSLRRV